MRVAVPGDDVNGDILGLISGKYYTDFNASCVREKEPSYEKSKGLWKRIIELAEEKEGSVKFPFMIQGFYILPDANEENYKLKIVSAPDFKVIFDERLFGKYNERKFNSVDKIGLPIFDENGKRTYYSRDDGLSGLFLGRYLGLYSNNDDLASSYDDGRVVLVKTSKAGSQK